MASIESSMTTGTETGFATGSGATWDTTSVNLEPGISPTQMSMTLDSQQRPHVAYMNIANGGDYSMR